MLAAQKKQEAEKAKQAEEDRIAAEEAEEDRIAAEEDEERKRLEEEERKRLEAENKAAEKLKKVKDDVDGLFKRAEKLHKENVPIKMDKESGIECKDNIYSQFSQIEEELEAIKNNNNDIKVEGDKVLNYVYRYQIHCSMDYLRDTDNKIPLKDIKDKIENIKDDKIKSELTRKLDDKLKRWYTLNVKGFKENIDIANDKADLQTLSDQLKSPSYGDKGDNKEGYKKEDKIKFKKLINEKIDILKLNELKTQAENANTNIKDNSSVNEIRSALDTVNKLSDESKNFSSNEVNLNKIKGEIDGVKDQIQNKLDKKMDAIDLQERRKIEISNAENLTELQDLKKEDLDELDLKEVYDSKLTEISSNSMKFIQKIKTLSDRFENLDFSSLEIKEIERKFKDINNNPLSKDKAVRGSEDFKKLSGLVEQFQKDMTYEKQAEGLINDLRISGSPQLTENYKDEKDSIDEIIGSITNPSINRELTQKLNNVEKIIVDDLIKSLITQNSSKLTDKYKTTKELINSTIETIKNTDIQSELIQKRNIAEKIIKLKLDDSGLTDFNDIKDYIKGLGDIKGGDRVYYNNKLLIKMYQLVKDLPDPGRSERREELGVVPRSSNETDKYTIMRSMIDNTPWKTDTKLANLRGLDALGERTGNLSDKIEEMFNTKITQKEITEAYSEAREAWERYKEEGLPITNNGFMAKKKKLENMYVSSEGYGQQSPQAQENKKIKATKEIKDLIEKIQILYGILDNYINLGSLDTEEKEKDRYKDMMTRKIKFSSTDIDTGKKLGFLEILKVIYNKYTYKWIEKAANKYIDGDVVFEKKKGTSPEDNKSKFISYMELFNTTMGKEAQQAAQTEEEREELKKKFDAMNELKTDLEEEGKGLPPKSGGGSRRKQTKKKKRR